MRKIINDADHVVSEMMEGFVGAYSRYFRKHPEVNAILSRRRRKDKVALVIGGGSGHEPMFGGFVGKGLADAAACGNIFASPDPNTIYEAAKAVDNGKGVLFVYGCYAGDNLNFDMGEEFLRDDGIRTSHVRVQDDVASAPKERMEDRRGIAGDVFVVKIAGAACDAGLSLEEVTRVTEKARDNTRTVGVATAPAQLPGVDKPIFELGEDEIEYGMGLHGERGVLRTLWQPADVLAAKMYAQIMEDADLQAGDEICVLVNGLGSTTITELAIVYRKIKELLDKDGIKVYDADLNNYCTSQEMGGFSVTFFQLDEELKGYYDSPCYCPYYAKGELAGRSCRPDEEEETAGKAENRESKEEDRRDKAAAAGKAAVEPEARQRGVLTELRAQDARRMLIYIADKIIEKKPCLTEIDSAIGDGDHGIGMAGGMKKAKEKLEKMADEENVYAVFEAAGKAMLMSMGGASGVIFGSLYLAGAKEMEPRPAITAGDLAQMEQKSLLAIQERGRAKVGDKTMVDALSPAVDAMKANCAQGLLPMLKAAEAAALQGVEDTKRYVAKFGRAKSLMERAVGYQDAGATSVWLIFQGMREYVEG
ncbi:dihydroxyacetone kinase subunit DhaL [Extibacter muris]|uniref:dihydroxyacetone kinase subunit DhaL n=1 Tax=Extibacter muris TaxID=1796622 RepID=UPI001D080ED3|nr:dihydroxyacetone kinase subunit DhaL [Extibacter muris]MCB6202122.1 dihydroxyacetone kinase subunit L [Extibacter muris]MCQ4662557.1 dihydroxyacetone kinase subunit DhaL [Extibacter muris]MCQ4693191.1 dihydroxyacetone kinase subunit DhaL [Extibacter muris]